MNQIGRIDFLLKVGNVSESVEVNATPPLLQTDSEQLGQIIDARSITAAPLATRNYVQLTLLAAGTVHPSPRFTSGLTTCGSGRPYVNGNREQANNFMLDGMDNNQVSDNLVGYAPSVDAIQEFNEITTRTRRPSSATIWARSSARPSSPAPISFTATLSSSSATTY